MLGTLDSGGNPIVVGGTGIGGVTISGGGRINAGALPGTSALDIGELAGGAGALTVDGLGSALIANGLAEIGAQGNGSLLVQNRGAILVGNGGAGLALGVALGAAGTLDVASGASANIDGPLEVGALGTGDVTIQSGGTLLAGNSATPWRATSRSRSHATGTVLVDGAGSLLRFDGGLRNGGGVSAASSRSPMRGARARSRRPTAAACR